VPDACKVVYARDFAPDDGSLDAMGHGTNVSGIVVGVAPDTGIIGLDVFRSDGYAYYSDILAALDWVLDNKSVYNIVAINMSLGAGRYTSPCPSESPQERYTTRMRAASHGRPAPTQPPQRTR
jgi:subtilisin family serine protease